MPGEKSGSSDGGDIVELLLFGLADGEPLPEQELDVAAARPAFSDHVDEADKLVVGIGAAKDAVEDEGQDGAVALACVDGAIC